MINEEEIKSIDGLVAVEARIHSLEILTIQLTRFHGLTLSAMLDAGQLQTEDLLCAIDDVRGPNDSEAFIAYVDALKTSLRLRSD